MQDHSKPMMAMLCKLADLDDITYDLWQSAMTLHQDGQLLRQKLSQRDLKFGPDLEAYIFKSLVGLPKVAAQKLLEQLKGHEMDIAEFKRESKLLLKLHRVQLMFLDLMGLKKWTDAERLHPKETTRDALEHFATLPLKRTPDELKEFCKRLKMQNDNAPNSEESFQGLAGSEGYFVEQDCELFDWDWIPNKCPAFEGASLIILDKPKVGIKFL